MRFPQRAPWIEETGVRTAGVWTAWLLVVTTALGCAERPSFAPGDECELNSECARRLVCRLGRCRTECRATRDCAPGLECVRDADRLGACQLETETECTLSSECSDILVCRFGQCTNACNDDVDCPPGSRCEPDEGGMLGCRDAAQTECALHSDCPAPLICAPDRRCREQCRGDRDCRDGTVCLMHMSPTVCGAAGRLDAGADASAGGDAGGLDDAGVQDGGPTDAGAMADAAGPPHMGAGFAHTCAAPVEDDLRCWGGNGGGQLGDGTTTPAATPYALGLLGVFLVAGGANHSCAKSASGLRCWGDNSRGQLGIGTVGGRRLTPSAVVGLTGTVTDLAIGNSHSCAIADATVYCWGDNSSGQLATGTPSSVARPSPIEVTLPGGAAQIASFGVHVCARLADGRVFCWGENGDGQIGNGSSGADVATPFEVVEVRGASHIATGSVHTCAIVAGEAFCWGNDVLGQLGDGSAGPGSLRPARTQTIAGAAIQLALGSTHSCARTASEVYCWGDNFLGQVGQDNSTMAGLMLSSPAAVAELGAVDEIVAGTSHTCARDGVTVRCFGSDRDGQLGDGVSGGDRFTPMIVSWP